MTEQPMRRGGWPGPRKAPITFKPDAFALAALRRYMEANHLSDLRRGDLTKALNAMLAAHPAARTPLTVDDIPAGQGAASLYIGPGPVRFESAPDNLELMYRDADGAIEVIDYPPPSTPGARAVWAHLAATLPTIDTTKEA